MNFMTFAVHCKCGRKNRKQVVMKCKCGNPLIFKVAADHIIEFQPCSACLAEIEKKASLTGYETGFNDGADVQNIPYGDGYGGD